MPGHLLWIEDVAAIEQDPACHSATKPRKIKRSKHIPLRQYDRQIGIGGGRVRVVLPANPREQPGRLLASPGIEGRHLDASLLKQRNDVQRRRVANIVGVGLECDPQDCDRGTADISKSAGTATTAGTADLANLARDAQTLAGQGVGAFENSSVVAFGKAPVNPASSSAEQVVLSWPELGVAVTTRDQGPCGGDLGVSFRNTRSSGASIQVFENDNSGPDPAAAPGGEADVCTSSDNADSFSATVTDTSGRALFVDCIEGNAELRCLGVRSE